MSQPQMPNRPGMPPMPPEQMLMQMGMSHQVSRILATSLQLGIFSLIGGTQRAAEEIARDAHTSLRGTAMLLDALVALQLIEKKNDRYSLTSVSARFLRRESSEYLGAMYENDRLFSDWAKLTEVVKTGKPVTRLETQKSAEEFFPNLVKSLHIMNREPAKATARALGAGSERRGLRVLDVACGSGVWSIAIAEEDRDASLTAQDFPGVLELTKTFLKRHEVDSRYEFLPGDLKSVDFGANKYDIALLGNIVHSEGEKSSRDLFQRMFKALAPGGKLAIIDMVPNDERTAPPFPLLFAINMLIHTEEGSTYTLQEYRDWLRGAGFAQVETADIGSHSPLIIASKK